MASCGMAEPRDENYPWVRGYFSKNRKIYPENKGEMLIPAQGRRDFFYRVAVGEIFCHTPAAVASPPLKRGEQVQDVSRVTGKGCPGF
jgi:hypothetical protein